MPSTFPGMDPYLEHREIWPDLHVGLIVELRNVLSDRVDERYYVAVEERTYLLEPGEILLVGRPDVAVVERRDVSSHAMSATATIAPRVVTLPVPEETRERYLEVREVESGRVVTVVELLSPSNKVEGKGRAAYMEKRRTVLGTRTSLVEIDLLRGGKRLPMMPDDDASDYRILVARGSRRPNADLYPFGVRDPIPHFPLPLAPGEDEIEVDLRAVLDTVYDRAHYERRIDYARDPEPPLAGEDAAWARELLSRDAPA